MKRYHHISVFCAAHLHTMGRCSCNLRGELREFWQQLRTFKASFWFVIAMHMWTSYASHLFRPTALLFLTDVHGYSDRSATLALGLLGALTGTYLFFTGAISDHYDLFFVLVIANISTAAGIAIFMITPPPPLLMVAICGLIPLGFALSYSAAVLSVVGFGATTNDVMRVGFAVMHASTQLPQLFADGTIDLVRAADHHRSLSTELHTVLLIALGGTGISLVVAGVAYVRTRRVRGGFRVLQSNPYTKPEEGEKPRNWDTRFRSPWSDVTAILRKRSYWKQFALMAILVPVATIPYAMDALFPAYAMRRFGRDVPYGTIAAVNPLVIALAAPLLQKWTGRYPARFVVLGGTLVSALAALLPMTDHLAGAVFFFLLSSLGESVWVPRMSSEVMAAAVIENRGTYNALVRVPNIAPQVFVGFLEGFLLNGYCPVDSGVACQSAVIWGVMGGAGCLSIVLQLVTWPLGLHEPIPPDEPDELPFSDWMFLPAKDAPLDTPHRRMGASILLEEDEVELVPVWLKNGVPIKTH